MNLQVECQSLSMGYYFVVVKGNRKELIKENLLDAVIGLPANLFYGTAIPTAILIFKKNREDKTILFIDASREFEDNKTVNKLRNQDIEKIYQTYLKRDQIDRYSHKATLKEVEENDYNLNIPRYVDTFEEAEPVDIQAVQAEINRLETKLSAVQKNIKIHLEGLGYNG